MDEAREETGEYRNRRTSRPEEQRHFNEVFNMTRKERSVLLTAAQKTIHHGKAFKGLSVQRRKELIAQTSRCFRCLAAGHQSIDCRNARQCGVDGCISNRHSSYLHEHHPTQRKNTARPANFDQKHNHSVRANSQIYDPNPDPEQWRHVPGGINPAGLSTRGMLASELSKCKLWLEGPDFLPAQEYTWPEKLLKTMPEDDQLLEKRLENLTHLADQAKKTTNFADRVDPTCFSSCS